MRNTHIAKIVLDRHCQKELQHFSANGLVFLLFDKYLNANPESSLFKQGIV